MTDTLLNPTERRGVWWCSSAPNRSVDGTLTYTPGDALRLRLSEPLFDMEAAESATVCGRLYDGRGAVLQECLVHGPQIAGPKWAFLGMDTATVQRSPKFLSCTFGLSGLAKWLTPLGPRPRWKGRQLTSIDIPESERLSASIESVPCEIVLDRSQYCHINTIQANVAASVHFEIISRKEHDIAWYLHQVTEMRTLAHTMLDSPVNVSRISLIGEQNTSELLYLQHPWLVVDREPVDRLLTLNDLFDRPRLLRNWFGLNKGVKQAIRMANVARFVELEYLSLRFLLLVQAIEVYHSALQSESRIITKQEFESVKEQIQHFVDSVKNEKLKIRIGDLLGQANRKSMNDVVSELAGNNGELLTEFFNFNEETVSLIRRARNEYAHGRVRYRIKGMELWNLCRVAFAILNLGVLKEIGVSDSEMRTFYRGDRRHRHFGQRTVS